MRCSNLSLASAIFFILTLIYVSGGIDLAYAEKVDKDKPIVLEANTVSVDDVQQIYVLDGAILLTKGSILITGDHGNIKVDPEGYEYIDVQGTPELLANFRQRREGIANEFMQGRGSVMTYNAKSEFLTLTGNASLKRLLNMEMLDQLQGWKIVYDDIKQSYRVYPPENAKPDDLPQARAMLSPRRKAILEK
jgi:lipopolysaccharide export system protein LptA